MTATTTFCNHYERKTARAFGLTAFLLFLSENHQIMSVFSNYALYLHSQMLLTNNRQNQSTKTNGNENKKRHFPNRE